MPEAPSPFRPQVVITQGFPSEKSRDGSVIFVVNLLSLFFGNREGARLLEDEISCVDSYGGRLLPVLGLVFGGGSNVLVLEREPDPALMEFFRHLGLNLPAIEILSRADFLELGRQLQESSITSHPLLDRLRSSPAKSLDGYVTNETIDRFASHLGKHTLSTPEGSHRGNNKLLLHQHMESIGAPVFLTRLAESKEDIVVAFRAFRAEGYRFAVVKSQIGASGIGLVKFSTEENIPEIPQAFFFEGPCMVQAWLRTGEHGVESVFSPSVQLFLNDKAAYLYDITEQILENSIHEGNESPPGYLAEAPALREEMLRQAGEAGVWLHAQGYRGPASADFLVTRHSDGSFTVYVCELNARFTGATYPSVLARHLHPHGAWLMRNLELATPLAGDVLLEKLRTHLELFDPGRTTGILPINFNLDPDGMVRKGQFLAIADDPRDCRQFLDTGRKDLSVIWSYTRDR